MALGKRKLLVPELTVPSLSRRKRIGLLEH
jgi:hypothetical protein